MTEKPRHRQVMTIALAMVISLWIHIIVLALWRYSPPVPDHPVSVPLVLEIEVPEEPPVSETAVADKPEPPDQPLDKQNPEKPEEENQPADLPLDQAPTLDQVAAAEEDTISLESKAPEYVSYLAQIKARVARTWQFPEEARRKRMTGRVTLVFTLDAAGNLLKTRLEEGSGHPSLDQAAQNAIQTAVPYPAFPEHINLKRLNIRANFDYRIRYVTME